MGRNYRLGTRATPGTLDTMQRQAGVPHAVHEQRYFVIAERDRTGHLFEIFDFVVHVFVNFSANGRSDAIGKSKILCVLLLNMKTFNVRIDSRDQDSPIAIDEPRHHLNKVSHWLEYHPPKRSRV